LARVFIRHSYYNLQDDRCRDLRLIPSKPTLATMKSLRLVFKEEPDGFGIYGRADANAWKVNGQPVSSAALSFEIGLNDSAFASITDLPLSFAQPRTGIYAANRLLGVPSAAPSLFAGNCAGEADVVKVAGAGLIVDVPAGSCSLSVLDLRGHAVLTMTIEPAVATNGGQVRVDLGGIPCGRYTTQLQPAGEPNASSDSAAKPFLILTDSPLNIGWLDLSVSRGDEANGPLEYTMAFDAISTLWSYAVASHDNSTRLTGLAIEGDGAHFQPASSSDAASAQGSSVVLVSDDPIPLREKSPLRLKLTGHRVDADGLDQPIELSPLPTPAASSSFSLAEDGARRTEVFVYV
jgi:hypothetical protein